MDDSAGNFRLVVKNDFDVFEKNLERSKLWSFFREAMD